MFSTFKDITAFINTDFTLIMDKELDKSGIESLANKQEPLFLQSNEGVFHITCSQQNRQLVYHLCETVSIEEDLNNIIEKLQDCDWLIVLNASDQIVGYLNTQRICKELFQKYQQLQAYIFTVLNTINESCTVIDHDKKVVGWTKGAEGIFSVKREDIIGKSIIDFFSTEHLEILNALEKGTSVYHQQHLARENKVVLINSNPVYFKEEIIGAVVAETDITSQIRLNEELYTTTEKLFHLEKEVTKLTSTEDPFQHIRGNSTALKKTITKLKKASTTEAGILIHGESGVGKELFAKAAHNIREDNKAPFVAINCGAIPSSLFESEIFGYERGAFSGADQKGKKGKAELAQGGTLFLDEIGEMPLDMQVKILRLLQERKFYPVGGTKEIEVDFRVIAATNRDLAELVKENKFRDDLYYRLNVVSIEIPPLRKRPEDIIELTHYFLHEISIKYSRPIHGISQTVMQALLQHDWPGNVRELKNVVERLVVFSENGEITTEELPFDFDSEKINTARGATTLPNKENGSLNEMLQEVERNILLKELKKADGNKQLCAKNLQITRATLYNRLNKLGIK
ncbi:sigma 54-interacting transcriptional regulator [Virgibacillus halodenitrificans]|uniref:sigma-54 interaction domain-containing protein n=1 Tax=Virgibacillus halodenitrificans TaxID=1482 RepID=UPI001EEF31A2|nr:sigma 54-interacting transcriptional regulator [Virgibacillus halodenitrificans]MCG1027154.1 sigma 54-interacting transcriptional regulator [Virgibacillus halodenitrificans]